MKTQSSSQPFRRFSFYCTVALCAAILLTVFAKPDAVAQTAPAATQPGTRIAVIDISFIFKNHPGFKAKMEGMKADVQGFEGTLRQRAEEMKKLNTQLAQFKPTSPEYKGIEARILKINMDGQAAATLKKKDFLQREAKIYYDTYKEIVAEVASLSERYGIGMVVRFNSEPITEDRAAILEGVNRAVVYQQKLNITNAVLTNLKTKLAAAGGPTARTAQPGVAPARPLQ